MEKNTFHHFSQTSSTHGVVQDNNEDLLALSLSSSSRLKPSSPPPSAPAPPLPPLPVSSPFGPTGLLLAPQTFYPNNEIISQYSNQIIPQAPPLPSSYSHIPTDHLIINPQEINNVNHSHPSRPRKNPDPKPKPGKTETIPPPFPWATSQRATVHTLDYLISHNMTKISGEVQCKKCNKVNTIEYDLSTKFGEVASFISENRFAMHCRAPSSWNNPKLPSCESCGSCTKPVVSKKRNINWLFLLLGGMLGCCKLSELKYFCKHSKNHRTGAKDRVLYLTYLGLCKQLDPEGPFDI